MRVNLQTVVVGPQRNPRPLTWSWQFLLYYIIFYFLFFYIISRLISYLPASSKIQLEVMSNECWKTKNVAFGDHYSTSKVLVQLKVQYLKSTLTFGLVLYFDFISCLRIPETIIVCKIWVILYSAVTSETEDFQGRHLKNGYLKLQSLLVHSCIPMPIWHHLPCTREGSNPLIERTEENWLQLTCGMLTDPGI